MDIKGKLFHSFRSTAKKVQSPSVVRVITLGACTKIRSFSIQILWWAPYTM